MFSTTSTENLFQTQWLQYSRQYKLLLFASVLSTHYANMSVQYTAIFHGCKNDYFQMKKCDNFLIFAQNIDCWYTIKTHNLYFVAKIRKKCKTPVNPSFTILKWDVRGYSLHGLVCITKIRSEAKSTGGYR